MMTLQEGGRVASGVVDALKSQPLSLALVVMNLALLAILYYAINVSVATRKHEFELMINNQKELRDNQRTIAQNLIPESEMRDVLGDLRDIKGELRACEAKIREQVERPR